MNHDIEDLEEDDNDLIPTTEIISEACPYCGKLDAFVERADFSSAYVFCNACSARGPVACQESDSEEEPGANAAIRQWNRRTSKPATHDVAHAAAERFRLLARHYLQALCEIVMQESLDKTHQLACAALGSNPPKQVESDDEEDESLILEVAKAIAHHGIGRNWDDFEDVNAHDFDHNDLKEYARAAVYQSPIALLEKSERQTFEIAARLVKERDEARSALAEIERLRMATTEGSLAKRADRMWEIACEAQGRSVPGALPLAGIAKEESTDV
ncbi:Lar family restriction alleviation protein [Rhizobium lentis]|uniref:Lar family restriction alleviation protein n=1 Tax=Rhizobium lentis TaxID=1138194 RepID=UPI001C834AAD|nr:Lar family restriction alleviation protein [Rhizobium lentis]MBX5015902.1 hypothetical protein [Rhizobium lentis]